MILVARHGETTWNLAGRYQGRMESALSARGVAQAIALGRALAARSPERPRITRIVASPLLRCAATARFVAENLGLDVETDERLLEIAHGTWDGRYRDDLAREDPARFAAWRDDPTSVRFDGGETLAEVAARWHDFATGLDTGPETLVVTHDVVVRCAILAASGRPLTAFWGTHVENAAYAELAPDAAAPLGLRLATECIATHLGDVRADVAAQAL